MRTIACTGVADPGGIEWMRPGRRPGDAGTFVGKGLCIVGVRMSAIMVCVATSLAASTLGAEPVADRILKQFTSDNYTVTWGTAVACKPNADLEIGDGAGHGGPLRWMRFRPRQDAVEVLSIELGRGWREYESKCPLDNGSVSVKHAQMGRDAYAVLLRRLGRRGLGGTDADQATFRTP